MKKCTVVCAMAGVKPIRPPMAVYPARLLNEAQAARLEIQVKQIVLGRYISFHDEVRGKDISRDLHTVVQEELPGLLQRGNRFALIPPSMDGSLAPGYPISVY